MWENLGKGSVEEARAAVRDALERAGPLLHDVENRMGGIFHGLLDRLNGTTITMKINIPPIEKAQMADGALGPPPPWTGSAVASDRALPKPILP